MIIGLSGYARSGKDTVAGMLIGIHGYKNIAFADPIRKFLYDVNPSIKDGGYRLRSLVDAYGWETVKTEYPEARELLQRTGVAARTHIDEAVWVSAALRQFDDTDKVVITDVRFKNEASMIKLLGGQIWRVTRIGTKPANDHISEVDMDDWDFDAVITNNSDMPNLIKQIRKILG